jgi:hypothetical protein
MAPESTIGTADRLCPRPAPCEFASMAELYFLFERLFLVEGGVLASRCGHAVLVFDHHFFHLAAVRKGASRLFMATEKSEILATNVGFGQYLLDHGGSRARNLPSAKETMLDPDEVWEDNPKALNARWVYVKEFDSSPYPYTVTLLGERPEEGGIVVPVSSFPCKRTDARKWRQGNLIYQKQIQPSLDG